MYVVHGTWVSGRKIEPGVHVVLKEGDTVTIGGSSRVYELHWLSQKEVVDQHTMIKEGEEQVAL
jgi:pSer/pThr/pTyr-binding forkhead associated (FHA) protein